MDEKQTHNLKLLISRPNNSDNNRHSLVIKLVTFVLFPFVCAESGGITQPNKILTTQDVVPQDLMYQPVPDTANPPTADTRRDTIYKPF
jgi:hypothetical protein